MLSKNNSKIFGNTIALYFRQILILMVSLYTVRLVLVELGIDGYGIFSAVAGLVAMGTFLSGSMAQATQRYFSFALGAEDDERLHKTFSVNFILYIFVAIFAFIILQTVGAWFVVNYMEFPEGRVDAGIALFHFATGTFISTIITSPFIAILIAHEDMHIYAYLSIFEAVSKLVIVTLLQYSSGDKLEFYGLLLLCVAVINTTLYVCVCVLRYSECQFRRFNWDSKLLREILGFTGWTIFGQISSVARTHAITVLLNQSFNPAVVAARAISTQVTSALNSFTGGFSTALYPPIVKSYSSGDLAGMFRLINVGSRLTFFLLWIFALPLIIEMDTVLGLWLGVVPPDAVLFTRLALIESLIFSLSLPLTAAARAPGKMRVYELSLGTIQCCIFLVAWLAIDKGSPAHGVFIVGIAANILMFAVRLYIVNILIGFPASSFLKEAVVPTISMVIASSIPILLISWLLPSGLIWSAFLIFVSFSFTVFAMYIFGLDKFWRYKVRHFVSSRLLKRVAV